MRYQSETYEIGDFDVIREADGCFYIVRYSGNFFWDLVLPETPFLTEYGAWEALAERVKTQNRRQESASPFPRFHNFYPAEMPLAS